jgi:hypothetical protein
MSLWWYPEGLYSGSFMSVQDIDGDGWEDLYIAGSWASPNHTILYGSDEFQSREQMSHLAEGPYGHTRWDDLVQSDASSAHGSDVNRAVIIDFERDGDLDIVSIMEDVEVTKLGSSEDIHHIRERLAQVLRTRAPICRRDEPRQRSWCRYYIALFPTDLDMDDMTSLVSTGARQTTAMYNDGERLSSSMKVT